MLSDWLISKNRYYTQGGITIRRNYNTRLPDGNIVNETMDILSVNVSNNVTELVNVVRVLRVNGCQVRMEEVVFSCLCPSHQSAIECLEVILF